MAWRADGADGSDSTRRAYAPAAAAGESRRKKSQLLAGQLLAGQLLAGQLLAGQLLAGHQHAQREISGTFRKVLMWRRRRGVDDEQTKRTDDAGPWTKPATQQHS